MTPKQREEVPLADAVTHMLEECRMILPGLQALFGFQLIAVFNAGFGEKLTASEQQLHLLALALVAIAGALVMTPAAYHRQTRPHEASKSYITLAGRLLLAAMTAMLLGIGVDFYLIARVILGSPLISLLLTMPLVSLFIILWFLLPRSSFLQRWVHGEL